MTLEAHQGQVPSRAQRRGGILNQDSLPPVALKKAALFGRGEAIDRVFSQGRCDQLAELTELYPHRIDQANFVEHAAFLRDREILFSTWGMPALTEAQLDLLPSLRAVFYAAGTVQPFARPFLQRGITVVSAWQANAVPVAEFTVAQILLSAKGYFRNVREFRSPETQSGAFQGRGNFGEIVAILGAGAIGCKVIELLRPYRLRVIVFDPFLSEEKARKLGVERVSLAEAFDRAYVVSNHLANVPETERMLNGSLFGRLRLDATFINTGRGITVDEDGMIDVLWSRPDLTALLDVTWPEPAESGSPLYALPNVRMSTHMAGSLGDEVVRLADYCIEEFQSWNRGEPLRYAVSLSMLEMMA